MGAQRTSEARSFFDLQVNGYAGVDFNHDDLTADDLHRACEHLAADDVEGCLATIITDDLDTMCARLRRIATLRGADPLAARVIAGIHLEGPFINRADGYRGAHPADAVRAADEDVMARLLEAAAGLTRIVTLAPECDSGLRVTRALVQQGIIVSAGHTNATLDELRAAIDTGLTMFTHVGNGCPTELPRHDNIIQRALSLADRLWLTFIADGVHVPFVALGNYLRAAGVDRAIVVSDAIAPAGLGPGQFTMGRWTLSIGDDMVARMPGSSQLVGSGVTMARSVDNLTRFVQLSSTDALRLTRDNPRRALGLGSE